jgi:hypothetical protein
VETQELNSINKQIQLYRVETTLDSQNGITICTRFPPQSANTNIRGRNVPFCPAHAKKGGIEKEKVVNGQSRKANPFVVHKFSLVFHVAKKACCEQCRGMKSCQTQLAHQTREIALAILLLFNVGRDLRLERFRLDLAQDRIVVEFIQRATFGPYPP